MGGNRCATLEEGKVLMEERSWTFCSLIQVWAGLGKGGGGGGGLFLPDEKLERFDRDEDV